jgi:hypothetical protein
MSFNPRGFGSLFMGDTSEEVYTAAGYDPSLYYQAPGFNIQAGAQAQPATQADQDAARRYLAQYGAGPAPPAATFDLSAWFQKNQTVVLTGLAVFVGLKMLGGRR